MRHRKQAVKLGRTASHRKALVGALVCGLIEQKRIVTTLPKARLASQEAEKLVTIGKRQTVAARRQAMATLRKGSAVSELFSAIVPQCGDRAGGWTRIIKTGARKGDGAPMALLEWTTIAVPETVSEPAPETDDEKA